MMSTAKESDDEPCNLLTLPHYAFRVLFSYLDATTLYCLSQTCSYIKESVEDPIFWKYIDARRDPNNIDKIQYCIDRINEKTTDLYLRGQKYQVLMPLNFFDKVRSFENLKILALENLKLNAAKVTLKDFPSSLEELSLKKTYVKNSLYFFQHSSKTLSKLRVLILDECNWITCSFLISISKFENLEILSAVKCFRVHLNMVPYLSVAKYGCKKLKILDFRFTGIGGELLKTFYNKPSIQRYYFQSFKTAEIDYKQNIDDTLKGLLAPPITGSASDLSLTDNSLSEFAATVASNHIESIKNSVLYPDPYPQCKCGYKDLQEPREVSVVNPIDNDYVFIHQPALQTTKFVCHRHIREVEKLPKEFKDFFFLHQREFHSDVTSDDDTSDSLDNDDERTCCIYAMGTKMVILPNVNDLENRTEYDLPGADIRNDVPFNIVVINPLEGRDLRSQNNQPGTSGSVSRRPSKRRERVKRKHHNSDDSDSDLDPLQKKSRTKGSTERSRGKPDDRKNKRNKKRKLSDSEVSNEADEESFTNLVNSTEDVCSRLNTAIENGIEAIKRQTNQEMQAMPSTSKTDGNQLGYNGDSEGSDQRQDPGVLEPVKQYFHESVNVNGELQQQELDLVNQDRNLVQQPNIEHLQRDVDIQMQGDQIFYNPYLQINEPHVKKKISLRQISLRGYPKITNTTLEYLKDLDIELIDLTYTNVTKSGIEDFLVHNPNCRVIHPLYCVCKPVNPK